MLGFQWAPRCGENLGGIRYSGWWCRIVGIVCVCVEGGLDVGPRCVGSERVGCGVSGDVGGLGMWF